MNFKGKVTKNDGGVLKPIPNARVVSLVPPAKFPIDTIVKDAGKLISRNSLGGIFKVDKSNRCFYYDGKSWKESSTKYCNELLSQRSALRLPTRDGGVIIIFNGDYSLDGIGCDCQKYGVGSSDPIRLSDGNTAEGFRLTSTTTNANGEFEIDIQPGQSIKISANGFKDAAYQWNGVQQNITFELKKSTNVIPITDITNPVPVPASGGNEGEGSVTVIFDDRLPTPQPDPPSGQGNSFTGYIIDTSLGEPTPLPGAHIVKADSNGNPLTPLVGTTTDVNGEFSLPLNDGEYIRMTYVGFKPAIYKRKDAENDAIFILEESGELDEVVVTATKPSNKTGLIVAGLLAAAGIVYVATREQDEELQEDIKVTYE